MDVSGRQPPARPTSSFRPRARTYALPGCRRGPRVARARPSIRRGDCGTLCLEARRRSAERARWCEPVREHQCIRNVRAIADRACGPGRPRWAPAPCGAGPRWSCPRGTSSCWGTKRSPRWRPAGAPSRRPTRRSPSPWSSPACCWCCCPGPPSNGSAPGPRPRVGLPPAL